jgi:hypothetical protein
MKSSYPRLAKPWKASFDIDSKTFKHLVKPTSTSFTLQLGWGILILGRDEDLDEFVMVVTLVDSFLLSPKAPKLKRVEQVGGKRDWVSVMKTCQAWMFEGPVLPTVINFAGFKVTHGGDPELKDFVMVTLPGDALHLSICRPTGAGNRRRRPAKVAPIKVPTSYATPAKRTVGQMSSAESAGQAVQDDLIPALG